MAEFFMHPVPAVIVMLGLLVFVHELGHYLAGRAAGIAVEIFSIGFGPRIFGWRWRGTEYRLSWIPLGGFVKFAGVSVQEDVPSGLKGIAFRDASLPRRAFAVAAGPLANFLLAVAIYAVLGFSGIAHPPALIGEVIEGSAAEAAGLKSGDAVLRIDGKAIFSWRDIERSISSSPGKTLAVTVRRDGNEKSLNLVPQAVSVEGPLGKPLTIGRAGIALGRLPAIVAITDQASPAALAGLRTGDRIISIEDETQTYTIRTLPDLIATLEKLAALPGPSSVKLRVVPASAANLLQGEAPSFQAPASDKQSILILDLHAARDGMTPLTGRKLLSSLGIHDAQLVVGQATETLAQVLQLGDVLVSWRGQPVPHVFQLRELLAANTDAIVPVTIVRDFKTLPIDLTLKPIEVQKPEGRVTVHMLPVQFLGQPEEPEQVVERYDSLAGALAYGTRQTAQETANLVDNLVHLFSGDVPIKALGGPMLIAKVAGDSARRGWQTFLGSMAMISINLGLLNLFPIPVLDGGQLILMGVEGVRRKPLREAAMENFQKLGFALILALVVLATYNDFSRFWKTMLESVVGLFQ